MSSRAITAGPGQIIGEVPASLDGPLIDGVADRVVGQWAFSDGKFDPGNLSEATAMDCPLCLESLYRTKHLPLGRVTHRLGRTADARPGDISVMIDLLPSDRLVVVACVRCQVGFTCPR